MGSLHGVDLMCAALSTLFSVYLHRFTGKEKRKRVSVYFYIDCCQRLFTEFYGSSAHLVGWVPLSQEEQEVHFPMSKERGLVLLDFLEGCSFANIMFPFRFQGGIMKNHANIHALTWTLGPTQKGPHLTSPTCPSTF